MKINTIYAGYLRHLKQQTREEKIEQIIHAVKAYPEREIPWKDFSRVCLSKGIQASSLSEGELNYIQRKVNK